VKTTPRPKRGGVAR